MNFFKIFNTALMALTLFIFTGLASFDEAQAKKHAAKNISAHKGTTKKYRRSQKNRRLRKRNTKNKKYIKSGNRKNARLNPRRSKIRHKKLTRRQKRALKKRQARLKTKRSKRSKRYAKKSKRVRWSNKAKYRVSASQKNSRLRHSIFKKSFKPGSIIVSFGDRKLYYFSTRKRVIVYPIGVPRKGFEWKGTTHVSWKKVNPRWTPTKRMREENPKLPEYVEGGTKANPLGVRALYLGKSEYRIHGTNVPWTIGKARSSGCIRMHNSHVIDLFNRVKPKAPVLITWTKYSKTSNKYASTRSKGKRSKRLRRHKSRNRRKASKRRRSRKHRS